MARGSGPHLGEDADLLLLLGGQERLPIQRNA